MPLYTELLRQAGFNAVEVENAIGATAIQRGLDHMPIEICGPATAVAGALLDHHSKNLDGKERVALITATGGPCRASNYSFIIGNGLDEANVDMDLMLLSLVPGDNDMDLVPPSLNDGGSRRTTRMIPSLDMFFGLAKATILADTLQQCANSTRPYEVEPGSTDRLTVECIEGLKERLSRMQGRLGIIATRGWREYVAAIKYIVDSFDGLERRGGVTPKDKTLVIGEIFANYQADYNYHIVERLEDIGREVELPDMLNFFM